jgi:hypothetical protein
MLIDVKEVPFVARLQFESGDQMTISVNESGAAVFQTPDGARINRFELGVLTQILERAETPMLVAEARAEGIGGE